jgi:hypothetical protein
MLYGADLFLAPLASNRRITITGAKEHERAVVKKMRMVQRKAALAITGALSTTPKSPFPIKKLSVSSTTHVHEVNFLEIKLDCLGERRTTSLVSCGKLRAIMYPYTPRF